MKQQGQEISKSTLIQQLNISKGNTSLSSGPSDAGLTTLDPKQQEIKQVAKNVLLSVLSELYMSVFITQIFI